MTNDQAKCISEYIKEILIFTFIFTYNTYMKYLIYICNKEVNKLIHPIQFKEGNTLLGYLWQAIYHQICLKLFQTYLIYGTDKYSKDNMSYIYNLSFSVNRA